ncbi:MAG: hypothetical protein JWQ66_371 [Mucilaginibacter sp.]|nr:hypothetical protein [Mucilaginibacter sp.]
MTKVLLETEFTRQKDLDACIAVFKNIQQNDGDRTIEIEASLEMKEFDIQFVAYLLLFKIEIPEIKIIIRLPFNDKNLPDRELEYKLKQYGTYAYLLTGIGIFEIYFGADKAGFELSNAYEFPDSNWYVLSKHFALFLFIKKDDTYLFDLLFEKSLHSLIGPLDNFESNIWHIKTDTLYTQLNRFITRTAIPQERTQCIKNLGRLAFYNALNQAKVLSIYLDKDYKADSANKKIELNAGKFGSGRKVDNHYPFHQYAYFERLKPIIDDLAERSLAHQFIFSTLISSALFEMTTIDGTYATIENLWSFTKELVYGLRELAKNLRDHTTNHRGVITARIYATEVYRSLRQLGPEQRSMFDGYLAYLKDKKKLEISAFFDLNVIDIGNRGIVPTLMKSSKDIYDRLPDNSKLKELLAADIELLRSVRFSVQDLLAPDKKSVLNQQAKRSIAHLGLMLFNKLITKNSGLLILSSLNPLGGRDTIAVPTDAATELASVDLGTYFHIILPIQAKKSYQTHLPDTIEIPGDSSSADIKGIEALFSYEVHEAKGALSSDVKKLIFRMRPDNGKLTDRADELLCWESIAAMREQLVDHGHSVIYNLDLDQVDLDGSQLFRMLGHWQAEYPKYSLTLSNIKSKVFIELVNINTEFIASNRGSDYWNAVSAILVYHYSTIRSSRFYFVDALWGRTRTEYRLLNKLISKNNFNYTSIFLQQRAQQPKAADGSIRPGNLAFYSKNLLLPLDIVLKTGEQTLFECNSLVLLENEIKPKSLKPEA